MQTKAGIHCFVSGKVQGVRYRIETQSEAQRLHLGGMVRNMIDGRVEVKAFGEPDQLALLIQWLHNGPKLAQVDQVEVIDIPWQACPDFKILA